MSILDRADTVDCESNVWYRDTGHSLLIEESGCIETTFLEENNSQDRQTKYMDTNI